MMRISACGNLGSASMRLVVPGCRTSEVLELEEGEVHVWQADLEARVWPDEPGEGVLSEDESERALRFHFPRDRRRFIAARHLLRVLLGSYLQVDPLELRFCYSPHGKPSLANSQASSGIRFNLSHSDRMALFAFVRGREVGVDVERIRRDFEAAEVGERFFSQLEREALATLPLEGKHEAFFHCWTRKEAFVKAKGDGLSLPLDQFDVSLLPGQPAQLLGTRPDPEERNRWSLWALDTGPEYAAAVVVEGTSLRLATRQTSSSAELRR